MSAWNMQDLQQEILELPKYLGAAMVGIAGVKDLKSSPSYEIFRKDPYYAYVESFPDWSTDTRSILIFGLEHEKKKPEWDWWDSKPGGSPGHRALMEIQAKVKKRLIEDYSINSISLPNNLKKEGIFLKDSSVLAGIGVIGKNNLLLTPTFGPRVRLRAMVLDLELESTGALDFDPCSNCDKPCFRACPQNAFREGNYGRSYCLVQMQNDEANERTIAGDPDTRHIRYCRACELSCPVGQNMTSRKTYS